MCGRTGGRKPKLGSRQQELARLMYAETGEDGKRRHTLADIAAELGVSRQTVYRALCLRGGEVTGGIHWRRETSLVCH